MTFNSPSTEDKLRRLQEDIDRRSREFLQLWEKLLEEREKLFAQNCAYREKILEQDARILKLEQAVVQLQQARTRSAAVSETFLEQRVSPSLPPMYEKLPPVAAVPPAPDPGPALGLPPTELDPRTRDRVNYYNQMLQHPNPGARKDILRRRWLSMSVMAMDMDAYQAREEVYLVENPSGSFYAVQGEGNRIEVYFDPGYSVLRTQVKAMFHVIGDGEYIRMLLEPAFFESDNLNGRLQLLQKGRLSTT